MSSYIRGIEFQVYKMKILWMNGVVIVAQQCEYT